MATTAYVATAYVVLFLDTSTMPATVRGAGIFSERNPTICASHTRTAALFSASAPTYGEASALAESALLNQAFDWIGEVHADINSGRLSRVAPKVPA